MAGIIVGSGSCCIINMGVSELIHNTDCSRTECDMTVLTGGPERCHFCVYGNLLLPASDMAGRIVYYVGVCEVSVWAVN